MVDIWLLFSLMSLAINCSMLSVKEEDVGVCDSRFILQDDNSTKTSSVL